MLPSLMWVVTNDSVTVGDPIVYKVLSLKLYFLLGQGFDAWKTGMLYIMPVKAPLLWWVGQFIYPIGDTLGSADVGLRLVNVFVSMIALSLLYKTTLRIFSNVLLAVLSCVILASAPLFIVLTTQFWTEPLQLLMVCWSLYLAVHANTFDIVRLTLLSSIVFFLSLLVKASMPSVLIFPLILGFYQLIRNNRLSDIVFSRYHVFPLIISGVLAAITLAWYAVNLQPLLSFITHASNSENYSSILGAEYFSKVFFWLSKLFFSSTATLVAVSVLALFATSLFFGLKYRKKTGLPFWVAIGSLLQLLIIIGASSFTNNQDYRYWLPLLPYFILLICYAFWSLHNQNLIRVGVLIFSIQFVHFHIPQFGINPLSAIPRYHSISPISSSSLDKSFERLWDLEKFRSARSICFATLPTFTTAHLEYYLLSHRVRPYADPPSPEVYDLQIEYDLKCAEDPEMNSDKLWNWVEQQRPYYIITNNAFFSSVATIDTTMGWSKTIEAAHTSISRAIATGLYSKSDSLNIGGLIIYELNDATPEEIPS
jgi:hypothetical protein